MISVETMRKRAWCWWQTRGKHDWKRAVRDVNFRASHAGKQVCKLCGEIRLVTLRAPRRKTVPAIYPTDADV